MFVQVALGFEGESARDAGIRPFVGVGPDVFFQHARLGARVLAVRADVAATFGFPAVFFLFCRFICRRRRRLFFHGGFGRRRKRCRYFFEFLVQVAEIARLGRGRFRGNSSF